MSSSPTRNAVASGRRADAGDGKGSVELRSVSKSFGGVTVVKDLDLSVNPGEFLSLLGPSGCGKTTTLRMLAGFEQPDSGEVLISGAAVQHLPPHKRDVNTVFQSYALFPHMTVAANIAYGLRQRRGIDRAEIRSRVAEALDMVQMTRFADRKPNRLSGGQQQRVALARALVNRPGVLLLDEPLAALDRKLREDMQVELKLLQSRLGTTFVFVTHDQEEALSMSDRVAVMLDGRIEQIADPYTVYERPATAFVAGFIGQQNFFDGTVADAGRAIEIDGGTVLPAEPVTIHGSGAAAVRVAVRPEAVTVAEAAPAGPDGSANALPGAVAAVSLLGDVLQYVVHADAGHELLARVPRRQAGRLAEGARVWCSWAPSDVHVFPAEVTPRAPIGSAK
ncbi:ABC transporter ATP-binding protein [Microtetraspora niveoalba]|uniref:ABC transporter ATP-binding protein n=1 Tax=Microtetraspora niveoalba TaxID=46175 RepID=UPI000A04C2CA|nr:ABC transporter ATP-binding protein [Microtetraspora niveoalba]